MSRHVRTRTLSITSGKGGVGKSTITSNVAVSLANQGKKVLILDGDLGMGNIDIMFGVRSTKTILDVLNGDCDISEIIHEVHPNISLIPGGSGLMELQTLTDVQKRNLLDQVATLDLRPDYMIVDTAPGIGDNVLYLNTAVNEINIVLTPDPSSMADSYALIKVLNKYHKETRFSIICNQVKDDKEGLALFKRISDVASKFLFVSLDYKGFIPADLILNRATRSQQLIVQTAPQSPSARAISAISEKLSSIEQLDKSKGGIQFFWEQLFQVA